MAAEDVGGIQAQVTADIGPFLGNLQKAENAAKEFVARYGRMEVVITATLRMPTQTALREYHRDLQKAIDTTAPTTPTRPAAAQAAAAQPTTLRRTTVPAAAAAEAAAPAPVAVIAAPVVDAGVLAQKRQAAIASRAAAQARADAKPGVRAQWKDENGNLQTIITPMGGAVGERGESVLTGSRGAATPVSFGGPREFAGGRRGVGGTDDFQGMSEEIGRQAAEIERLRDVLTPPALGRGVAGGRARAAQVRAAGPLGRGPGGQFADAPEIITRADRRAAIAAGQTGGAGQPAGAFQEPEPLYRPPATTELEKEWLLWKSTLDEFSEAERQEAAGQLGTIPRPGSRGRGVVQRISESRSIRRRLSPQERAGAKASLAEQGIFGAEEEDETTLADVAARLQDTQLRNIRSQQRTQQRALGTTLGGGVTTLLGGAQARDLQIEAKQAEQEAFYFQKQLEEAKARELAIEKSITEETAKKKPDPEKIAASTADLAKQRDVVEELAGQFEDATAAAEDLSLQADAAAKGGLRNISGAFTGALLGSLAFGVGMTAVQTGIELMTVATREGIGSLTGWRDVANETSKALAQQTVELHGLSDVATASLFAQTALTQGVADTIRPLVEQRAAMEAGSAAFSSQIDLIHTWVNLRQQAIEGGGIPGFSTGIGGVFGTPILAQPGIVEQLARLTPSGQSRERGIGGAAIGAGVGAVAGGLVGLLGGPVGVPAGIAIGATLGAGVGGAIGQATGPTSPFQFGVSQNPRIAAQQAAERAEVGALQVEAFGLAVDDLNAAVKRGTPGVEDLGEAITGSTDQAAIDRTQRLLAALDVPEDQRQRLEEAGFVLDRVFSVEGARAFAQAAGRGFTVPEAREVLQQLRERVIPARNFQLTETARFQRELIQIQAGVQRAGQPFLPLGTTVPGGTAAASGAVQPFLSQAQGIDRLNVQRIAAARVEIANLALPGERGGAVASFDRLQGLGQQAAGLQTFITQSQVNLATHQYNEQLRIARLQLGDLAVLTGRVASSGGDNLGVLEKQNIQLQRSNSLLQIQLSTLQLELQQRQINFQVAIAGFTAPGVTGAERAARIEQAELEASFAQKQLDLQKEMLSNQAKSVPLQIAIQDIQFSRDYQTALNAINLLTEGRQVTIDVAAAQEALQRINSEIEIETANLQTFIQAGSQAVTALIADQAKYIETYTTATEDLQSSAADFFQGISSEYANGLIRFLSRVNTHVQEMFSGGGGGGYTGSNYTQEREGGGYQTGFYGSFGAPTRITVGDAGNETVAILRNPQEMMWNGGGGGTSINLQITVTGNNVRSDQDIETLTSQIARKVEESLSRRTSLLGFRPS